MPPEKTSVRIKTRVLIFHVNFKNRFVAFFSRPRNSLKTLHQRYKRNTLFAITLEFQCNFLLTPVYEASSQDGTPAVLVSPEKQKWQS